MILLTKEQILLLHEKLIVRYGGTQGVRDYALLDSAVFSPNQTFDGNDIYPTVKEKAVRFRTSFGSALRCQGASEVLSILPLLAMFFIVIFSFYSLSIS